MKLYVNLTSPFVRVTRMAILEKGLDAEVEIAVVDAWADAPDFLDANPAGRVPALLTDEGVRLSEASLILRHLDAIRPDPVLVPAGPEGAEVLSRAGLAFGVFDAAAALIIGRKSAPDFDAGLVGTKRHRTMREGLARIERTFPAGSARPFDLADIAAITALDYLLFRFADVDWRGIAPRLSAFRNAEADRPSVRETNPRT